MSFLLNRLIGLEVCTSVRNWKGMSLMVVFNFSFQVDRIYSTDVAQVFSGDLVCLSFPDFHISWHSCTKEVNMCWDCICTLNQNFPFLTNQKIRNFWTCRSILVDNHELNFWPKCTDKWGTLLWKISHEKRTVKAFNLTTG